MPYAPTPTGHVLEYTWLNNTQVYMHSSWALFSFFTTPLAYDIVHLFGLERTTKHIISFGNPTGLTYIGAVFHETPCVYGAPPPPYPTSLTSQMSSCAVPRRPCLSAHDMASAKLFLEFDLELCRMLFGMGAALQRQRIVERQHYPSLLCAPGSGHRWLLPRIIFCFFMPCVLTSFSLLFLVVHVHSSVPKRTQLYSDTGPPC